MSFIWEKLLSTEAVLIGIERQTVSKGADAGEHCYQHFVSGELCQLGVQSSLWLLRYVASKGFPLRSNIRGYGAFLVNSSPSISAGCSAQ